MKVIIFKEIPKHELSESAINKRETITFQTNTSHPDEWEDFFTPPSPAFPCKLDPPSGLDFLPRDPSPSCLDFHKLLVGPKLTGSKNKKMKSHSEDPVSFKKNWKTFGFNCC